MSGLQSAPELSMIGSDAAPLLEVRGVRKYFAIGGGLFGRRRQWLRAVDGVDLTVRRGETLGIVGESGCGKSTLARLVLRLVEPDAGAIRFEGQDVLSLGRQALKAVRREMQLVSQDPYSSLNPLMPVVDLVGFNLWIRGERRDQATLNAVLHTLDLVGLSRSAAYRYPHELSGGQRQRVSIARALVVRPKLVIFDEAVSALDKSVQAQVLNLLRDLQAELGLTYVFISHDLNVVEYLSDRVAVMYLGKVVEMGSAERLYEAPRHPYTTALLSATPSLDLDDVVPRIRLEGDIPSPIAPPSGCGFRTRCPRAMPQCAMAAPPIVPLHSDQEVTCYLYAPDVVAASA